MLPSARRMVAMPAYFGAVGLLNEQRLKDIVALGAALEDEPEAQAVSRRVRRAGRLGARGGGGDRRTRRGAGRRRVGDRACPKAGPSDSRCRDTKPRDRCRPVSAEYCPLVGSGVLTPLRHFGLLHPARTAHHHPDRHGRVGHAEESEAATLKSISRPARPPPS
jgi:hypothetical protein